MELMKKWMEGLRHLMFPIQCLHCGAEIASEKNYFCIPCMGMLPKTGFEYQEENPVEKIFRGRIRLRNAMAYCYFTKGGGIQKILHRLKYDNDRSAADFMGRNMAGALKDSPHYGDMEIIIPVPMFKKKEASRGYNQAELIGRSMAAYWSGAECISVLRKNRETESQTRKSRWERQQNAGGKYTLDQPQRIEGRNLILIDDVITTGATLEACAAVLLEGKPASVSVAAFAWAATMI